MGRRSGVRKPVTLGAPVQAAATTATAETKKKSRRGTKKSSSSGAEGGGGGEEVTGGEHAQLIAQYHALNKYRESLEHDPTLTPANRAAKRRKLDAQLAALGGLEAYQRASLVGETAPEHKFNAGKWVVSELRAAREAEKQGGGDDDDDNGKPDEGREAKKLRLLDVGAIKNQYLDHASWLDVTAIDLNPQHPSVIKADFFEYSRECKDAFDVVVLSLVINFVGDPRRKGEMLVRCRTLVRDGGTLFIVLPLACMDNSRYMKHSRFVKMLKSLGFELTKSKTSPKLSFFVFRKLSADERAQDGTMQPREFKRKLCRGGLGHNNFCIILAGPGRGRAGRNDVEESEGEVEEEEEEEERSLVKARKRTTEKASERSTAATSTHRAEKRKQPPQRAATSPAANKRQKTRSAVPPSSPPAAQQKGRGTHKRDASVRVAASPKDRALAFASRIRP